MHTEEYHGPCPEGVTIYPGFDKESSMINWRLKKTRNTSNQRERSNKLIIGHSMVKGIEPRGLQPEIKINVNQGADSLRITKKLHYMDLSNLSDVIIYAGGNDGPNGTPPRKTKANLEGAIETALEQGCMVWLCLIAPRVDSLKCCSIK